jgi:hypothetical protein
MTSSKPPVSPKHKHSVPSPELMDRYLSLEQQKELGLPLEGELIISVSPALSSKRSPKK